MSDNGKAESTWHTMNRRFTLLLRLMRGGASKDDLIDVLYRDAISNGQNVDASNLAKRLDRDKAHLKKWFQVEINYNRSTKEYELVHLGRPLLDLSEEAVRGFAFLEETFRDDNAPMGSDVRDFLRMIEMLLPYERGKEISKQRLLQMQLAVKDTENIAESILEAVETSASERRQLEFSYLSSQRTDGDPTINIVEPIRRPFFDAVWQHYYLEAFYLKSYSEAHGWNDQNRRVQKFRLDRMQTAKVLSTHYPANRRIPTKELIYELNASVARLDVTEHFPDMQIFHNDDGSAKVVVASRDLFFDLRTLLHYGANCRVIGGKDALYEMKRIIKAMMKVYEID